MSSLPPKFKSFTDEVHAIHRTWLIWTRLFHDPQAEHDQTIFENWSHTWGYIRWALLCNVILGIGRLLDRRKMTGRDNLTLELIWDEMKFSGRDNLEKASDSARAHFAKTVDQSNLLLLRNRVLAHNDLNTILGIEKPDENIETINKAVHWLRTFQWRCESLYEGRLVRYDETGSAVHPDQGIDREIKREVDDLISYLQKTHNPRRDGG